MFCCNDSCSIYKYFVTKNSLNHQIYLFINRLMGKRLKANKFFTCYSKKLNSYYRIPFFLNHKLRIVLWKTVFFFLVNTVRTKLRKEMMRIQFTDSRFLHVMFLKGGSLFRTTCIVRQGGQSGESHPTHLR